MSLATLRALHAILADALNDIQRVYTPEQGGPPVEEPSGTAYASSYASPPPSPSTSGAPLDFPSLDAPYDPNDPAEQLSSHPVVVRAINRIVAAAGQMAATVQPPFYALCDAAMGYHLPSCLRLLEASHTVELLREAGSEGLHVDLISQRNAHVLRLLATHHFIRERSPDVFATNRISSFMDSGKSFEDIKQWEREGRPEMKYHDTNGVAAFIGMCTDELFKSSAYLTEAYLLARTEPPRPPFEYAFRTDAGFFAWLEGEGASVSHGFETGDWRVGKGEEGNSNKFRLERFGTAMSGTGSWEAPGAVFNGGCLFFSSFFLSSAFLVLSRCKCFDWRALRPGSIVVDVGGGIGSTSMLLANAFSRSGTSTSMFPPPSSPDNRGETRDIEDLGLKFVIQDREVVVAMGEKAWRAKCPELLDSGAVQFQVHDFFTPQPIKNAAVFFLRVILHDWPDAAARHILLHLREAAAPDTKLVLADFVLPLACVDVDVDGGEAGGGVLEGVEGAESMLAPAPLLANLGKASANAYWMDLTMQVTFNAQERTLRETAALALSAGWKVVKMTCAPGSLFGHIVAVPVPIPVQRRARAGSGSRGLDVPNTSSSTNKATEESVRRRKGELDVIERASSRCGTPTFGSRTDLPSMQEAMARFGGGIARPRSRLPALVQRPGAGPPTPATTTMRPGILKQPAVITSSTGTSPSARKKKPSPLSFPNPLSSSPSPVSPRPLASPRLSQPTFPVKRRMSLAQLRSPSQQGATSPVPPVPRQAPPSPMSPRHPHQPPLPPQRTLTRRASHAHLTSHHSLSMSANLPPSPSLPSRYSHTPTPTPATPTPRPRTRTLSRAVSHAQLYQSAHAVSGKAGHHTSIPVPVRQTQDAPAPHPSPSLSYSPRTPATPAGRPATPRYASPTIGRRASHAPLPQTALRKRSGSIIVPPIHGTGAEIGGAISMTGLLGRGAAAALNFGQGTVNFKEDEESEPAFGGAGSVLAAAARIERGVLSGGRLEFNDEDVIS
ncbi:hypothetical protein D9615_005570 [Tricholomella constricta]|uniref:O-methyltransferase C-terminal domain-containing protein n=1 Tax=Tricholomella constricta TaxID=117010 RepID=A0A8H5M5Q1_9AGAR|nr:hypothetical protein D9615_005570 [Tricholomella constricta]